MYRESLQANLFMGAWCKAIIDFEQRQTAKDICRLVMVRVLKQRNTLGEKKRPVICIRPN